MCLSTKMSLGQGDELNEIGINVSRNCARLHVLLEQNVMTLRSIGISFHCVLIFDVTHSDEYW